MGEGRFGPVFRAHHVDGEPVLIRIFTQTFSPDQRERVLSALDGLCLAPLEHPSIACPVACGVAEDGRLYVVHTYLEGTPLSDFSAATGRRGVDDIVRRLSDLAGALDFAAAANVVHGALSDSDVIFSSESAGVSGLGLVQALESAGVDGFHARRENDVAALMEIAGQLLGEQASPAAQSLLAGPVPATALAFAAALHRTLNLEPAMVRTLSGVRQGSGQDRRSEVEAADEFLSKPDNEHLVDIQLRHDEHRPETPPTFQFVEPEQTLEPPAMFGASQPTAVPGSSHRGAWLIVGAAGLAAGIFAGFAGGWFVREAPPPAARTESPKPEPTNGQTYTDAAVDDVAKPPAAAPEPAPVEAAPAVPPPTPRAVEAKPRPAKPAAAPPVRTARQSTVTPAPSRSGPAAMMVDSRPVGAQVFVDGQSVGYTPLVVGELSPGTHSVRMQLPGYRPWVSAVTLAPGARQRVAASLEQ